MSTANLFFQTYISFIVDVFIILMWGWGILYALSKVTKYKKMLLGAFGCLGMLAYHMYEGLQSVPNELLLLLPNFEKTIEFKNEIIDTWQNIGLADYNMSFVLLFQICIIACLAGRLKSEETLTTEQNIELEKNQNVTIDNDLETSGDYYDSSEYVEESSTSEQNSQECDSQEYDSQEYDSQEYDSQEFDSQEFDSQQLDSRENESQLEEFDSQQLDSQEIEELDSQELDSFEDSEEYIEAYTESQASREIEEYIPVDTVVSHSSMEIESDEEDYIPTNSKEISQNLVSTPEIQADELLEDFDEDTAKAETFSESPQVSIPLKPRQDDDFTISEKSDAFEPVNSTQVAIAISEDESSSMQQMEKEYKGIAIPTAPHQDSEVEATLACNMDDIIQDDELPGFEYERDETFANLGNDDEEGTEPESQDPKYNKKNNDDDDDGDDDKRSLLRNLLPTK